MQIPFSSELNPKKFGFWLLILASGLALLIRLKAAVFILGFPIDINNFVLWSYTSVKKGLIYLYSGEIMCDYPPLYLLILNGIGEFAQWSRIRIEDLYILIKIPGIIGDIILAWIAYSFLNSQRQSQLSSLVIALCFLFHPVLFFESSLWGQMDSLTACLHLLSIWFLIRGWGTATLVCTAFNILMKPQGLILLPLILTLLISQKKWRALLTGGSISFALAAFTTWPFTGSLLSALPRLAQQYLDQAALYPHNTVYAFNFWGLFEMGSSDLHPIWGGDSPVFWLWQQKTAGLALFGICYIWILFQLKRTKYAPEHILMASSAILMAFFLLPTRMHERYLFSAVCFFLILCAYYGWARWSSLLLSCSMLANLLFTFPGRDILYESPAWLNQLNLNLVEFNFFQLEKLRFFWILLNFTIFALLLAKIKQMTKNENEPALLSKTG